MKLKRMMWSLCLYVVLESTDEQLLEIVGVIDRSSAKSYEFSSIQISSIADQSQHFEKFSEDNEVVKDCCTQSHDKRLICFEKESSKSFPRDGDSVVGQDGALLTRALISSGWAMQAYNDAVTFALGVPPYSYGIGSKAYVKLIQIALVEAFNDILWPHLESRGWLREIANGRMCIRANDETVRLSPSSLVAHKTLCHVTIYILYFRFSFNASLMYWMRFHDWV